MLFTGSVSNAITSVLAAGGDPLGHVKDKPIGTDNVAVEVGGNPLITLNPLTMNTLTLIIAAILTLIIMNAAANAIATGDQSEGNRRFVPRTKFGNLIEVIVTYLMDSVLKPQLGHDAVKFAPLLLSTFFFIWFNNLLGLVPLLDIQHLIGLLWGDPNFAIIGGTATGRLGVTAALAFVVFLVWNAYGIKNNGLGGWLKHFLGGAPVYLAPLMIVVEVMGLLIKPAALAVRLFANMTAGHVLLATLVMLPVLIAPSIGNVAFVAWPVTTAAAVAIFFLEIFVATLQAFIFFFLTTIFISQMQHHEHDDHAGAEAYDYDHPAEHDRAVPVAA